MIERECILADGEFITERELASSVQVASAPPEAAKAEAVPVQTEEPSLSQLECERIREVMQRTGGNKVAAARLLGLSRRALYRRLERYGLDGSAVERPR